MIHASFAVVAVVLVFTACTSFRSASGHVPAPGRYEYTAQFHRDSTTSSRSFIGSLLITEATRERIVGRWEVPTYQPELQGGGYASGAYLANADVSGAGGASGRWGTFEHRISRAGAPTNLQCTGTFVIRVGETAARYPVTCTLRPHGR